VEVRSLTELCSVAKRIPVNGERKAGSEEGKVRIAERRKQATLACSSSWRYSHSSLFGSIATAYHLSAGRESHHSIFPKSSRRIFLRLPHPSFARPLPGEGRNRLSNTRHTPSSILNPPAPLRSSTLLLISSGHSCSPRPSPACARPSNHSPLSFSSSAYSTQSTTHLSALPPLPPPSPPAIASCATPAYSLERSGTPLKRYSGARSGSIRREERNEFWRRRFWASTGLASSIWWECREAMG
jgi:hypothetical protein